MGMLGTMVKIARTEGPLRLYAGLSASILRQATYSTVRFGVYEKLKQSTSSCKWNDIDIQHVFAHMKAYGVM